MGFEDSVSKYAGYFILIVVGFSLIAVLYPEAADSGDQLNDTNMCENNGCFYNSSRTLECTANNETGADTTACANSGTTFPFSELLAGGGVVFIVMAAGILIYFLRRK